MCKGKNLFLVACVAVLWGTALGADPVSGPYCNVAGTSCLAFDGTNDYVDLGNNASLRLSGDLAVSAWVKLNPGTAGRYMGIAGKLNFGRGFVLVREHTNKFKFITANGYSEGGYASAQSYTDSEWHHIAGVLQNGQNSLYVDGTMQAQGGSGLNVVDSGQYAFVGRQYSGWSDRFFSGLIDDVRFYNRALNATEVGAAMSTPGDSGDFGLVGYWTFEQGQGQAVLDMSGYGNDGSLGQNQSSADNYDPVWTDTGAFCQTERTYHVSGVSGSDTYDGLSEFRAFRTIQRGINAASTGDTVIVAEGVYTGQGNKNLDFAGRAMTLMSAAGPDHTVIDCQDNGRGFIFQSGETEQAVLDGFTIVSGNADRGGGIYCLTSSPTIKNCVINGCNGFYCGGIYCKDEAAAVIIDCKIMGNAGTYCGGLRVVRSDTLVVNTVIAGNASAGDGGGIRCDYGPGQPAFVNCTVADNHAAENGGGLWAGYGSNPEIQNSILWGNTASKSGDNVAVSTQTTLSIDYSDVQGAQAGAFRIGDGQIVWGQGNVNVDPQFADPAQGNYHLKSHSGRYWPLQDSWVNDIVTSPCIDAGDPASDFSLETNPNGSRINLGAFGGTVHASLSGGGGGSPTLPGDFNNDGIIDYGDLFALIDAWLDLYGSGL